MRRRKRNNKKTIKYLEAIKQLHYKESVQIILEQLLKAYNYNFITILSNILNSNISNKLKHTLIDLLCKRYKRYLNNNK